MEKAVEAIRNLRLEVESLKRWGARVGKAPELLKTLEDVAVKAASKDDIKTVYEIEALVVKVYETVINYSYKEHYLYELARMTIAFCDIHEDVCHEYKLDKLVHEYVSSMLQLDLP